MKQEITTYIFGEIPIWRIYTNLFLGGVGLLMPYMYWAMKRDPHKGNTPVKFSIKVFVSDNYLSIVSRLFFLALFLVILCPYYQIDISPALALIIGAGLPLVVSWFMENLPTIIKNLLPSLNKIKKMEEYIWELTVQALGDTTTFQEQEVTASELAQITNGEIDGLDIIYNDEPDIPELTFTKWDNPEVTYLSGPVRRPINPK